MIEKAIPIQPNARSGARRRLKVRLWLAALLLGVGLLGALREDRPGGDVTWANSYEAGLALARQSGKPLLFSFHTPGCGWCQKLDAETFTDPTVVDLTRQFVCVRLDSDVDIAAVARYQVMEYPTTLFADARGKELARLTGYLPPDRFAPALRVVLKATTDGSPSTILRDHGPTQPLPQLEPPAALEAQRHRGKAKTR